MMTAVDINPFESKLKKKSSMPSLFNKLLSCFIITSEKRVKRKKLIGKDFDLPEDQRIANYDPELVAKFWNARNVTKPFWIALGSLLVRGIYVKLLPVAMLYIILYYVLNTFVFDQFICNSSSNNTGNSFSFALASYGASCNENYFQKWITMEKDFTVVLTFFIGFLVMILLTNYFRQLSSIPQLDQLLIFFDNFDWGNPTKNKMEAIKVREEIITKGIRKTILRYYILAWAMCLSKMSRHLMSSLPDQFAFNRKKLLLKREYEILICGTSQGNWREKWSAPLLWITKLVNALDQKETVPIDVKMAVGKTLSQFCKDLQNLCRFNDYRMPSSLIALLTLSIYVFLIISVVAAQNPLATEDTTRYGMMKFILDIPIFMLVKYLMLFGWLQVATDLTVPFGKDRYTFEVLSINQKDI